MPAGSRQNLLLGSLLLTALAASAQTPTQPPVTAPKRATVTHTDAPPELDGIPDEPFWRRSTPAVEFWDNFPSDSTLAEHATTLYFASDGVSLFVAAVCEAPGDDYVIPSLRRDYRAGGNDNLTFVFDPFRTGRNALVFGMNPLGVNREALISNGGESGGDFEEAWDNKWRGQSHITETGWTCELAIPLRSLRYPAGDSVWHFNAYRFDTQSNSRSSWNRIPRNQMIMSLAYQGQLVWEAAPARNTGIGTLIPFAAASRTRDFEATGPAAAPDNAASVGGDAKFQLTSGLNLDLTVNPDFSQVEVDRQVINLTRFEVSFPERRQFFLENADLFGGFGFRSVNPFFSRRIGLTQDTATGLAIPNPIYYGARLNGQIGDRWRVGLLNMQAAADKGNGLPSYNYTVAAVQRRVGRRSSLGAIAVNKDNFTEFDGAGAGNLDFNRVFGVDYNLASEDNRWNGQVFAHASVSPEVDGETGAVLPKGATTALTHGLRLEYRRRNYDIGYDHAYVPADYRAEAGFVPRRDFVTVSPEVNVRFFPTSGPVAQHGPRAELRLWFDADLSTHTDQRSGLGYGVTFLNTAELSAEARYTYLLLRSDFDPSRTDATPLPTGSDYGYYEGRLALRSDRRKRLAFRGELSGGQFFNGSRYGVEAQVSYRLQPYAALSLDAVYNRIDLPAPYAQGTDLFLLGPRADVTLTRSLFLTGVAQYNSQIDNVNLNFRLQWRYAPVSDLFVVYTDNINSATGAVRNRAIVAKVTYWFNA